MVTFHTGLSVREGQKIHTGTLMRETQGKDGKLYAATTYADKTTAYSVNGLPTDALPDTPATRELLRVLAQVRPEIDAWHDTPPDTPERNVKWWAIKDKLEVIQ